MGLALSGVLGLGGHVGPSTVTDGFVEVMGAELDACLGRFVPPEIGFLGSVPTLVAVDGIAPVHGGEGPTVLPPSGSCECAGNGLRGGIFG